MAFYFALLIAWLYGIVQFWPPGLLGGPTSKFGVMTDALFIGWIAGGILAAVQFLYILAGREILEMSSSGMDVRVVMGPSNKSLHYAFDEIGNLR